MSEEARGVEFAPPPHGQDRITTRSRWWAWLVDGRHTWGSLEIGRACYGFAVHRLVVFHPGISAVERRYLRLARAWPLWGTSLWLLAIALLMGTPNPLYGMAIATVIHVCLGATVLARTAYSRDEVRTMAVTRIRPGDSPREVSDHAELVRLAALLTAADTAHGRGQLSAVTHELIWWYVYDQVELHARR